VGRLLHDRIDDLIDNADVIVLGMKEPRAMEALLSRARPDQLVIDLVGLPESHRLPCRFEGLCW